MWKCIKHLFFTCLCWCKVQFKPLNSLWDCRVNPSINGCLWWLSNSKQTLNWSIFEPWCNFRTWFTLFTNFLLSPFIFFFRSAMAQKVSGSSKSKLPVKNGHSCFHLCERTLVLTASFNVMKDRIETISSSGNWLIWSFESSSSRLHLTYYKSTTKRSVKLMLEGQSYMHGWGAMAPPIFFFLIILNVSIFYKSLRLCEKNLELPSTKKKALIN